MPLTAKGKKILRSMIAANGKKHGTSEFYASKNKGVITGVDADGSELSPTGAESWVGKHRTGYRIDAEGSSLAERIRGAGEAIGQHLERHAEDAFNEENHPRNRGKFTAKYHANQAERHASLLGYHKNAGREDRANAHEQAYIAHKHAERGIKEKLPDSLTRSRTAIMTSRHADAGGGNTRDVEQDPPALREIADLMEEEFVAGAGARSIFRDAVRRATRRGFAPDRALRFATRVTRDALNSLYEAKHLDRSDVPALPKGRLDAGDALAPSLTTPPGTVDKRHLFLGAVRDCAGRGMSPAAALAHALSGYAERGTKDYGIPGMKKGFQKETRLERNERVRQTRLERNERVRRANQEQMRRNESLPRRNPIRTVSMSGKGPSETKDTHEGFAKLESHLAHEGGIRDPAGLAAAIGRKKMGKAAAAR